MINATVSEHWKWLKSLEVQEAVKNPLEQFLSVEDRSDGTYIKVTRAERDALQLDVILKAMANSIVMNFDVDRFKDVFSRARGAHEKIGSAFEYYDVELDNYLTVTVTSQKASIKIPEALILKGKRPNVNHIQFYLRRKNVLYGIEMGLLTKLITGSIYDQFVDIAFSAPPVNGTDAQMEMKINISKEIKPQTRSDGSVDYRNIQTFTSVSKGDLLAIKIPASPGKPGVTVTGEPIPSQPGKDIALPGGRNTEVSPDGSRLIASATGIIFYENGLLHIAELLHIPSDVDFSVGNIKYSGDILINGSVKPGFVVEAEGSIQIKGGVESARIVSRNGSVIIDKGIMGKNDTFVTAKKGISVCFAQDATFTTEGCITLEKYLLHCNVTCGTFDAVSPLSSFIGGELRAEKSIVIKTCGSDKEIPTRLVIFDKNKHLINCKLKELNDLKAKLLNDMQPVEKQLRTKAALLKKAGEGVSDRHREEVKKWVDAYNEIKKKIVYVDSKIAELTAQQEHPTEQNGYISVLDKCFTGTDIALYDALYHVKSVIIGKRFAVKNKIIVIEG